MTWLARGALLPMLSMTLAACPLRAGGDGDPDPDAPWFEFGHLGHEHFPDGFAVDPLPYDPLEDGERVDMIFGGQGAVMFALPVRAGNFALDVDADPPAWPQLDMYVDVEDHNEGVGNHFFRLANYPVWFDETGEEEYEFFFLTILVPDEYALSELEDLPGTIHATLQPKGESTVTVDLDFVVGEPPP